MQLTLKHKANTIKTGRTTGDMGEQKRIKKDSVIKKQIKGDSVIKKRIKGDSVIKN